MPHIVCLKAFAQIIQTKPITLDTGHIFDLLVNHVEIDDVAVKFSSLQKLKHIIKQ